MSRSVLLSCFVMVRLRMTNNKKCEPRIPLHKRPSQHHRTKTPLGCFSSPRNQPTPRHAARMTCSRVLLPARAAPGQISNLIVSQKWSFMTSLTVGIGSWGMERPARREKALAAVQTTKRPLSFCSRLCRGRLFFLFVVFPSV